MAVSAADDDAVEVTLTRSGSGLDFSVKGGAEHGIPIIVSKVLGGEAERCGELHPGTEILSVNGVSLHNATHAEAVALLKRSGPTVVLVVRQNYLIRRVLQESLEASSSSGGGSKKKKQHAQQQPQLPGQVGGGDDEDEEGDEGDKQPANLAELQLQYRQPHPPKQSPRLGAVRRDVAGHRSKPRSPLSSPASSRTSSSKRSLPQPPLLRSESDEEEVEGEVEEEGASSSSKDVPGSVWEPPRWTQQAEEASDTTSVYSSDATDRSTTSSIGPDMSHVVGFAPERQLERLRLTSSRERTLSDIDRLRKQADAARRREISSREQERGKVRDMEREKERGSLRRAASLQDQQQSSSTTTGASPSASRSTLIGGTFQRSQSEAPQQSSGGDLHSAQRSSPFKRVPSSPSSAANHRTNSETQKLPSSQRDAVTALSSADGFGRSASDHQLRYDEASSVDHSGGGGSSKRTSRPVSVHSLLHSRPRNGSTSSGNNDSGSGSLGSSSGSSSIARHRSSRHGLPEGWVRRKDPATGRTFYANLHTRQTTWISPVEDKNAVSKDIEQVDWDALPRGWERTTDEHGDVYFINHFTKTTAWEGPREQLQREQIKSLERALQARQIVLERAEARLGSKREAAQQRQERIDALSRKRKQLQLQLDRCTNLAEQSRLGGQIEIITEQLNEEISLVVDDNSECATMKDQLEILRLRLLALEQLVKEIQMPSNEKARLSRRWARRLKGLWDSMILFTRQVAQALSSLDEQRRELPGMIQGQVADPSLMTAYLATLPECHLQVDGTLKTDFEMRLDTFVIEQTILPQLQDLASKVRKMDHTLHTAQRSVLDEMTSADGLLSDDAMAQLVVDVRDLEMPIRLRDKIELAFGGSDEQLFEPDSG